MTSLEGDRAIGSPSSFFVSGLWYARIVIGPGAVLGGRYTVQERLGAGAMGAVFRAVDAKAGREVAIKVLHAHVADAELRARFAREARLLHQIDHPGVVRALDWIADSDGTALVMELVPGESLRARLDRDGPLPVEEARRLGAAIFDALAAAHAAGVVHRDVKPGNVVLAPGPDGAPTPRLLDFGLATSAAVTALTETGTLLGTPAYMAPEVLAGDDADARSDQYSAGCLVYEMLSGARPFADHKGGDLYLAIRDLEPTPIATLRPDAPPDLVAAVTRAMAKRPGARYATAAAAREAISPTGYGSSAPDERRPARAERRPRRALRAALALAGLLLVAPLATATITWLASGRGATKERALVAPDVQEVPSTVATTVAETTVTASASPAPPPSPSVVAATSALRPRAVAPRCRCRMRLGERFYGYLCLKPQTPVCECIGNGTTCFEPWSNQGWGCAKQTVTGAEYAQGQPCSGFINQWGGPDGGVVNLPTTGKLHCDVCDMRGKDYAPAKHGTPCRGFSNTGSSNEGVWECD